MILLGANQGGSTTSQDFGLEAGAAGRYPFISLGIVKSTDDPEQLGRLKLYCPALDHQDTPAEALPWARYISPFGGQTDHLAVGPDGVKVPGVLSYGFWAIPKVGANVLVFLLDGDPNLRCWFATVHPLRTGMSLPHGFNRNSSGTLGRYTEDEKVNTLDQNQATESGLMIGDWFTTRGAYERSAAATLQQRKAQAKAGDDGYAPSANDPKTLDPQTYSWTSPGQHFFLMSDAADSCRVRIRTTTGHQVILDDTNERIYISTNTGKTYIELDSNGLLHIFSEDSISVRTKSDFNVTADNSINLSSPNINLNASNKVQVFGKCCISLNTPGDINTYAGVNTHLKSGKNSYLEAGASTYVKSGENSHLEAVKITHILSGDNIQQTGKQIHLNSIAAQPSKSADTATVADLPKIVPEHEPWIRPLGRRKRNSYWKP